MSTRTLLPLFSTLGFGLLLSTPAFADCADVDGWNYGRHGKTAQTQCQSESYAEAFRLGEALAELQTRHAALESRIQPDAEDAGVLRRQQRQLAVDIEAIHGVATLRGWPVGTPQEEAE
ncbi:hypothetical protein [Denitratimonas sp. CY0512]|uniref:hypothetical protein n=1 Tax=Denitratimonas sp. CY0512 TaxID=3131940 RepID=UPI0030B7772D